MLCSFPVIVRILVFPRTCSNVCTTSSVLLHPSSWKVSLFGPCQCDEFEWLMCRFSAEMYRLYSLKSRSLHGKSKRRQSTLCIRLLAGKHEDTPADCHMTHPFISVRFNHVTFFDVNHLKSDESWNSIMKNRNASGAIQNEDDDEWRQARPKSMRIDHTRAMYHYNLMYMAT